MIIFDMRCGAGHEFEGWFKSREELDREGDEGRLSCPLCADDNISVLATGGHLARRGETRHPAHDTMAFHRAMGQFLAKNFEDVGSRFAEEAVKMHLGEAEKRNIRGTLTPDEERSLTEDGIEFYKVPVPKFDS